MLSHGEIQLFTRVIVDGKVFRLSPVRYNNYRRERVKERAKVFEGSNLIISGDVLAYPVQWKNILNSTT